MQIARRRPPRRLDVAPEIQGGLVDGHVCALEGEWMDSERNESKKKKFGSWLIHEDLGGTNPSQVLKRRVVISGFNSITKGYPGIRVLENYIVSRNYFN